MQSEGGRLFPSDSRTCGLRHELGVFRRGQRHDYHPHQQKLIYTERHCVLNQLFHGSKQGMSLIQLSEDISDAKKYKWTQVDQVERF